MNDIVHDNNKAQVLVADDQEDFRTVMEMALAELDVEVVCASDGAEAMEYLDRRHFDLVISDHNMPRATGIDLLRRVKEIKPNPPLFILISAFGTLDMAIEAMRSGADDFLNKPFEVPEFTTRVEKALASQQLQRENRNLRQAVESHYIFSEIIGTSKALRECLNLAAKAADNASPVLILGESGTGKDLLARAIHFNGPRRKHPFIAINCGAIPENLIESELFGHKKGSFTGAISNRQGCFEEARAGTLFLDEIGEMPLDLQVKLLRVLEARKIRRLGENREIPVDCRVMAATNRPLQDQVQEGKFREDLYYRLNVLAIELPPLRARPEDIIPLAKFHMQKAAEDMATQPRAISPEALDLLQQYEYPGNVRELFNILQRALLLCDGEAILPEHLPPEVRNGNADTKPDRSADPQQHDPHGHNGDHITLRPDSWDLKEETRRAMQRFERQMIARALEQTDNNYSQAARLLGISRGSLYNKIERKNED